MSGYKIVKGKYLDSTRRRIFTLDTYCIVFPLGIPCIAGINPNTLPFATFPRQVTDALEVSIFFRLAIFTSPSNPRGNQGFFPRFFSTSPSFIFYQDLFLFPPVFFFFFFFHLRLSIIIRWMFINLKSLFIFITFFLLQIRIWNINMVYEN